MLTTLRTRISGIIQDLSFYLWRVSLSTHGPEVYPCCSMCQDGRPSYGCIMFHYTDMLHFACLVLEHLRCFHLHLTFSSLVHKQIENAQLCGTFHRQSHSKGKRETKRTDYLLSGSSLLCLPSYPSASGVSQPFF